MATVVVTGLFTVVTARLFVWPPSDRPERVDAVVVLSGDHGERLPRALRLMQAGTAPTLVLAGEPDTVLAMRLCDERRTYEVVCLRPNPDSTRAEARSTGRLAAERRWRSVLVVTTTHHVTRAELLFRRCFDGRVLAVGADPPYGWRTSLRQVVDEGLKVGHALLLERSC